MWDKIILEGVLKKDGDQLMIEAEYPADKIQAMSELEAIKQKLSETIASLTDWRGFQFGYYPPLTDADKEAGYQYTPLLDGLTYVRTRYGEDGAREVHPEDLQSYQDATNSFYKETVFNAAVPGLGKTLSKTSWLKKAQGSSNAAKTAEQLTRESVTVKLERYLLNADHVDGASKAKWFEKALGFTKENTGDLAKQIVFDPNKAVKTATTEFGTKYNQVIPITGPNGKTIDVVFAWIENNDGVVRLITAIPTKM